MIDPIRCTQCHGLFSKKQINDKTGRCYLCIRADKKDPETEIETLKQEIKDLKKRIGNTKDQV